MLVQENRRLKDDFQGEFYFFFYFLLALVWTSELEFWAGEQWEIHKERRQNSKLIIVSKNFLFI